VPEIPHQEEGLLGVLKDLTESLGFEFHPTLAAQAIRSAIREFPPTEARAARKRLQYAANALGMSLVPLQLSVREAVKQFNNETPLAIWTITSQGTACWFVLKSALFSRARIQCYDPKGPSGEMGLEELSQALGASNPDAVLEWFAPRPASPMAEASSVPFESAITPTSHHSSDHFAHGDHGDHHQQHLPPFRRLLGLLRPERGELLLILVFAVAIGLFTLTTPVVTMAVVNTVALGTLVQQLLVLCVALLVALSLAAVITLLQTIVIEFIQRRVFVRVAADLAYRLPRVDLKAFDRQHGPELVNRFFDVLTVQKAGATLLFDGITLALQALIGMLLLGYYHTYLLGFDLVLLASLFLLFFVLGRGGVRTAVRESILKYRVAGWMEEIARHPVAFKMAGGPQLAIEETDKFSREYLLARKEHFHVLMRQIGFALFLQVIANVALLGLGGVLVIRGELTLGELVAAEIVVTLVLATFSKIGKQLESYYDLLAAVDKLGHLLDLPLERADGERHQLRSNGARVVVHDIVFTHVGQHSPAISRLNLAIEPGERVALVGPNGAGKSTLVDLLFGLRNPEQGYVEIDGAELRSMRLDTIREHVALVKGIEIIESTVIENVRMGRDEISLEEVREALRQVGLLEAVRNLPDGLNTMLWTGGSPLSLGQANRLMVARAIAGQPRLLILDEALDHMDEDIRDTILPALLGPNSHWTLILITHSPDVAKLCDRTIRLDPPKH
jgi:ABC-type bacteriocin/lantibiotic exporter with double-glycine peptidase domain